MYILTTLEFPKHNLDFHLLTTSVNAKYYYLKYILYIYLNYLNYLNYVKCFEMWNVREYLNK